MIMTLPVRFLAALAIGSFMLICGCADSGTTTTPATAENHKEGDDEGHQHPETYPESVAELQEMFAKIKEAFAAGEMGKADPPIHEAPHLLEELPLLASRLTLEEPQKEAIKNAIDSLSDALGKLDATVHKEEGGATWDDVGASIDAALQTLQEHAG